MNNQDKAAEVIRTWQQRHKNVMDDNPDWAAQNLATDLHNAGLIVPDVPDLDSTNVSEPGELEWSHENPFAPSVWVAPSKSIMVRRIEPGGFNPHEARVLALALLAAANYSEEE